MDNKPEKVTQTVPCEMIPFLARVRARLVELPYNCRHKRHTKSNKLWPSTFCVTKSVAKSDLCDEVFVTPSPKREGKLARGVALHLFYVRKLDC